MWESVCIEKERYKKKGKILGMLLFDECENSAVDGAVCVCVREKMDNVCVRM